jgi:DNA-binding transcriptional ArsR family regulator
VGYVFGVIATFAALAEPNRFQIVEQLRQGARSVGDLCERLDLSQPLVSKHLRILKEAGLVDVEPRSRQRFYELRAKPLRDVHDWLDGYRRVWDARFGALDELFVELDSGTKKADTKKKEKETSHGRKRRT